MPGERAALPNPTFLTGAPAYWHQVHWLQASLALTLPGQSLPAWTVKSNPHLVPPASQVGEQPQGPQITTGFTATCSQQPRQAPVLRTAGCLVLPFLMYVSLLPGREGNGCPVRVPAPRTPWAWYSNMAIHTPATQPLLCSFPQPWVCVYHRAMLLVCQVAVLVIKRALLPGLSGLLWLPLGSSGSFCTRKVSHHNGHFYP